MRNTLKYVADKDRKPFTTDLKTIYQAPTEEGALEALERVTEKWSEKYPNSMKSWRQNWDAVSPIFKFSTEVRKVIYTTNAIESLSATYRKLNCQRSVFPSDTALLKALYLSTFEATKNGLCRSVTGGRFMGNWALCTRDGCRNNLSISRKTGGKSRLFLTCPDSPVIYRTRAESSEISRQPQSLS